MNFTIVNVEPIYKNIIGYVASTLSVLLFLPQLVHMIKRQSSKDISHLFLVINQLTIFSWFTYGVLDNSLPLIIGNIIITLLNLCMICCKCIYDKKQSE